MSYIMDEDTQILSLFGDDASLWGQLPDEDHGLHLGSSLDLHLKGTKLTTGLDSTGPSSPHSDASDDPLPDWMSEKVSLSAWLGDEEDIPMADLMTIPSSPTPKSTKTTSLEAEELFQELLEDIGVPRSPSLGEEISDEAPIELSPSHSFISDPASPDVMESMLNPEPAPQQALEPTSPMDPEEEAAPVMGLEEQALALLDAMAQGGIDLKSQDISGTQVITITLPLPSDQMSNPHMSPPESPSSVESSMPPSPEESPVPSPQPTSSRRSRAKPKLKNASPIEKKSRKRTQNKEAATRYRQKKKVETDALTQELNALEDTNNALKEKAEGLEKEIKYLKDLMLEIRLLKGSIGSIKN